MFFEGFTRIVTVHGGKGPPLLLLHGNPFSHLSWQRFAPRLAQEFAVVATDLRGYGDSEKPPGGNNHENYSFRVMAQDQIEVMAALGRVSRASPVHTAVHNCTRDEGRPFEVGSQVLISSHRKLLLSKAMVVSVAETPGHDPGRQG